MSATGGVRDPSLPAALRHTGRFHSFVTCQRSPCRHGARGGRVGWWTVRATVDRVEEPAQAAATPEPSDRLRRFASVVAGPALIVGLTLFAMRAFVGGDALTNQHPDILSFIRSFDIFVMSSLFEGLGTSLLDAMALSKPTVASDTGGIPEVVAHGETGLLVPPRDSKALASAISTLLKDPRRRERMGRAGLERVTRLFTAEEMVDRTLGVYRNLKTRI